MAGIEVVQLTDSMLLKLEGLAVRRAEVEALLASPEVIADQPRFRELSREYAELQVVDRYRDYLAARTRESEALGLGEDPDPAMRRLAAEDLAQARDEAARLTAELRAALVPRDPLDNADVFLELRAGTGGNEAALFAGDLLRMYQRLAERSGWETRVVSSRPAELGGFKEVILHLVTDGGLYGRLKFESGIHRVQRVPETESQGRIHTSACTVAVLPQTAPTEEVEIARDELRIDTFRASGAGGQHVNKTDSAVRITHLPSGLVVECQDGRSQHKNRARAMELLYARLLEQMRSRQRAREAHTRRLLVGSGDRSEKIRTYNFPQGRVTDHRINLSLYRLAEMLDGDLAELLDALASEHQVEQLATPAP